MSERARRSLSIVGSSFLLLGFVIEFLGISKNPELVSLWSAIIGLLLLIFSLEEKDRILEKKLREASPSAS